MVGFGCAEFIEHGGDKYNYRAGDSCTAVEMLLIGEGKAGVREEYLINLLK